jgi:putative DNA primase/helicase
MITENDHPDQPPSVTPLYSGPTAADLDRMPRVLTTLRQWVLWRGADRVDTKTGEVTGLDKIPYDPHSLHKASVTDDETWGTFQHCVDALPCALEGWEHEDPGGFRGGGIGCVVTLHDAYCGVDLDHCRDPQTGAIAAWASTIVRQLDSYTEVTPTQTGLRIWVEARLPAWGRKHGHLEMYDHSHFLTVTGWTLPDTPPTIHARHDALSALHQATFGPLRGGYDGRAPVAQQSPTLTDVEVLTKARQAANSARFTALWAGEWAGAGTHSEGDYHLCAMLGFWTQDVEQISRLFEQSGLFRADKWGKRPDYRQRTITAALTHRETFYQPRAWLDAQIQQAHDAAQDAQQHQNGATAPMEKTEPEPVLPYSDFTNARALVRDHGAQLRYCYPWKSWLVWTGTHWQRDTSGEVMRLAKATVKKLAHRVADLGDDDPDEKKKIAALMAHIKSSLSTAKLRAMVECAQSEPGIAVQPEELDTDPWLLNCANGTLDLRTGELRDHAQADLLTKCVPIDYVPTAQCHGWQKFLWRIMGGSPDADSPDMREGELTQRQAADDRARGLIDFLQRAVGYTLTGSTREQCLFILHGITKTGKTTFLATLRRLYGPYGQQADMETFMHKDRPEVRNDLAALAGSRFVSAVESQEGKRLAENLIKQLTGGVDVLTARFLFQEHFTFKPQFKVFLGTNHKPVIKDTDSAIWERIRLVPFTVQIPVDERDKTLDERLQHELPGILAWAVRGCLAWQKLNDLKPPEPVVQATASYRSEMDAIGRFLDECCIVSPHVRVKMGDLYTAYKQWCERTGEVAVSLMALGKRLDAQQFEKKTSGGIWRVGLGLMRTEGT